MGPGHVERFKPVAELLDREHGGREHMAALEAQAAKLHDPELTPSARVLQALRENGKSFTAFGLHQSEKHAAYFRSHPPSAEDVARFTEMARVSIAEQEQLERTQTGSFDDYVKAYRASNLCPNHCT